MCESVHLQFIFVPAHGGAATTHPTPWNSRNSLSVVLGQFSQGMDQFAKPRSYSCRGGAAVKSQKRNEVRRGTGAGKGGEVLTGRHLVAACFCDWIAVGGQGHVAGRVEELGGRHGCGGTDVAAQQVDETEVVIPVAV